MSFDPMAYWGTLPLAILHLHLPAHGMLLVGAALGALGLWRTK